MHLTCFIVKRQSGAYADGQLRGSERARVASHLQRCESCAAHVESLLALRSTLRALPGQSAPPSLTAALRVIASRERAHIEQRRESWWDRNWRRWWFQIDQLMRPVALPAAGGLLSSIVFFSCLILTIGTTTRIAMYEVPLAQNSGRVPINLLPLELRSKEVILTLNLDPNGRIREYAFNDGASSTAGDASTLHATSVALPELPGVLGLTRPIYGDIQISFTPIAFRQ